MTSSSRTDARPRAMPRAARAAVWGVLAGTATTGLGFAVGLVPEGAAGHIVGGAALACVAGALGCLLQARLLASPVDGDRRSGAQGIQLTLGLDFAIKLLCVLGGVGVLWSQDVKFEHLGAFAIAFATVALIFQLVSAVALARAVSRSRREALASTDPGRTGRAATNG